MPKGKLRSAGGLSNRLRLVSDEKNRRAVVSLRLATFHPGEATVSIYADINRRVAAAKQQAQAQRSASVEEPRPFMPATERLAARMAATARRHAAIVHDYRVLSAKWPHLSKRRRCTIIGEMHGRRFNRVFEIVRDAERRERQEAP
jgi:hypothetical protein